MVRNKGKTKTPSSNSAFFWRWTSLLHSQLFYLLSLSLKQCRGMGVMISCLTPHPFFCAVPSPSFPCSTMGPPPRIKSFTVCSSLAPFHSVWNWLLQCESLTGHSSCQKNCSFLGSPRLQLPPRHVHLLWEGASMGGCFLQHVPAQAAEEGLSGTCSTLSHLFSDLEVCRLSPTFFFSSSSQLLHSISHPFLNTFPQRHCQLVWRS